MMKVLHTVADSVLKHIQRSRHYYRKYNNTLPPRINRTYVRYAAECKKHYKDLNGEQNFDISPLIVDGGTLVQNAFPAQRAKAHVDKISALIEQKDPSVDYKDASGLSIGIKQPLITLGEDLLDVLHTPAVNAALLNFFQSNYRIEWATCYRSVPSEAIAGSWFWHSDSFPPHTCKLFLHLTEAMEDTGATQLMNREDTMAYRDAGYFGQQLDERYADLQDFAKEHKLPYRPFHNDANAGDATILDQNFFHRAVAPRKAFRDIVSFFFVPNILPWYEQLERDGIDSLTISGVPKDPHPKS
ncbi:MAG: hypothetical protein HOG89_03425 [Candidatus Peribacter sp.]|jgi:hypothetical protein|nr:hypothetical protein [Candidatus Peribacter sp.]MBT4393156.1 hypothetical protein [Candidatus Peribacter sp.]MBT4600500.1 hypothetical protein [Candidatus Peribacter sp.]MBT5148524.1 hypothetical protein [Candidatus Peribacter sp.]MBT5638691.1 hypothetical protein [Candidatus Peribacter sp.]